eukprot:1294549-Rhodomonas_salina.4
MPYAAYTQGVEELPNAYGMDDSGRYPHYRPTRCSVLPSATSGTDIGVCRPYTGAGEVGYASVDSNASETWARIGACLRRWPGHTRC